MRKVLTTPRFERRLKHFLEIHPKLDSAVEYAMSSIAADKKNGLRVHSMKGAFRGCRAARISHEYRIIFVLKRGSVCFIDIGTHDDVYR